MFQDVIFFSIMTPMFQDLSQLLSLSCMGDVILIDSADVRILFSFTVTETYILGI